jgi:8-oxo-dGTP pyrophosphatase MutT (NUDIX family)
MTVPPAGFAPTPPSAPARPAWVADLERVVAGARAEDLSRFLPPPGHRRRSAVLMLFGPEADGGGPDVLLTERSATMRSHPGQVSFPGGAFDPGDDGAVACALREAAEETGLGPAGVEVLGTLPAVYLPVSDHAVTPVVGWWREPTPVAAVDPAEVARAVRVPVRELLDPAARVLVTHPSGWVGPGFEASGLFVWGFTAGLLDRLFALAGWERPWDRGRLVPAPLPPQPPPAAGPGPGDPS